LKLVFPRLSLRSKLALVALVLLALPWAGYNYVREMERFLLEGQEQALLATARAVATALHDRPGLLRARPSRDSDFRREAEEELRRLAAERGETEPRPDEGVEPVPPVIIDREESAARREIEDIAEILKGVGVPAFLLLPGVIVVLIGSKIFWLDEGEGGEALFVTGIGKELIDQEIPG